MAETISTNVSPIRELDEPAALDWLRAQPGGRTKLSAAELGRRWGWPRQRTGRYLKAWAKAGLLKRRGDTIAVVDGASVALVPSDAPGTAAAPVSPVVPARVPPAVPLPLPGTAPITPSAGIDVAAYVAAIALASVAALFSVKGMVQLFPGTPLLIIVMACAMEAAKLVAVGWLARRWCLTTWTWRLILVALIVGLAVINATGVYAQLVAAHVGERGAARSVIETRDAAIAAKIDVQAHAVADLDRRLNQVDVAIEEAAKRGRTTTALTAMEGQRKTREALSGQRQREASTLADLKAEHAALGAKGRQVETEAAPIRYVAELVGADTDSERAIRWLILMMVLCCDPLAITLTAAASARR
jgi:hypothetical protein